MPSVEVDLNYYIERRLRNKYSFTELQNLLFEFGLELEEEYVKSVTGPKTGITTNKKMIKIDVPSNRYDLLCGEGISRALRTYLGECDLANYKRVGPNKDEPLKLVVMPETLKYSPYIVGAILRNISFTNESYRSFIDVQEKLHFGLGRDRSLAYMGTHDYDKLAEGPVYFKAIPPKDLKFCPLFRTTVMDGIEITKELKNDPRLKKYMNMICDFDRYPVLVDSSDQIFTMPPVINSEYSKVSVDTKNLFIVCSGHNMNKLICFLDVVCATFSEYCKDEFTVDAVEVVYPDKTIITPELAYWDLNVSIDNIISFVGVDLSVDQIESYLYKMGYKTKRSSDNKSLTVVVPPNRHDVISEDDIFEDITIMYGYSKIIPRDLPPTSVGTQQPRSQLTTRVRTHLAIAGFIEVLTFTLVSKEENSTYLRKKNVKSVEIANPKALEYEVIRNYMAPSLLKTLASNQSHSLPIKLFEISDIVIPVPVSENLCHAQNRKHLCMLIAGKTPHFEIIHGALDWLMEILDIKKGDNGYSIASDDDNMYMQHRCLSVLYKNKKIGNFGIIHPEILGNFGVNLPTTLLEIDCEEIISDLYPQTA